MLDVAVIKAWIAILISNPLQFLFELLFIYLIKVKVSTNKPNENCKFLSWQLLTSIIFITMICFDVALISKVTAYGRPNLVFSTFLFAWIFDQVKSVVSLALVYCVVVRRFMHLSINENEYLDISKMPPK